MKTIIKEINVLEIDDIENAIFKFLGERVKINEIDCLLTYWIDVADFSPNGMSLEFKSTKGNCSAYDLFYDEKIDGCYYLDGKLLGLSLRWLPSSEIFSFDTSAFKSFSVSTNYEH